MPTTSRLRVLLAAAAVVVLPVLALATPGTAGAAAPVAAASPTPCPITDPGCLAPRPSASATPSEVPTASPTPSPTPTRSATPSPSPRRTSSPRPRSTRTATTGSTQDPVTGSVQIGGVAGAPTSSGSPTTTPATNDTSGTSRSGDHLTRLLVLVLGGAVLLGVSGATGLYLTRHRG